MVQPPNHEEGRQILSGTHRVLPQVYQGLCNNRSPTHWPVEEEFTRPNEETDRAFEKLKQVIVDKPVLRTLDLTKDFILQTDVSGCGIGAVLTQNFEDEERPVAFFSKKLLPVQTRYTATEKEGLAVVKAIQHFEFYLYGRPFKVQTDHTALKKIKTMTNTNGRLVRWSMLLQSYDLIDKVVHATTELWLDW